MAQLKSIQIEGYKSIRRVHLELHPMNIVIGPNGAGKSNLISFLQVLQALAKGSLDLYVNKHNGASHILYHGSKRTSTLSTTLSFENMIENDFDNTNGNQLTNANEFEYSVTLAINANDQLTVSSETSSLTSVDDLYEQIANWQFYRFHQASDLSVVQKLYNIHLTHPKHYKRIISTLKQILPFFDDFIWTSEHETDKEASFFYWKEKGSTMIFNTSHMSDGMVRMISLITLLLQPTLPSLICIDEPELGLHPYAINVIAALLQTVSLETQLIVSTQSVTLLNAFDIQDIIVVNRRDGQSTFERLQAEDFSNWLQEYTVGELWEKNILGGRPS